LNQQPPVVKKKQLNPSLIENQSQQQLKQHPKQLKAYQPQLEPHQSHKKQPQLLQESYHLQQMLRPLVDQPSLSALNQYSPPLTTCLSTAMPNQSALINQPTLSSNDIQSEQHQPEQQKHGAHSQNQSSNYHSLENQQTKMMDAMFKLVDLHTAPAIDIDVFSGDPLEYDFFRATFHDVVERKIADPVGRLMRLYKYTAGDAKELIKHCIREEKSTCFDEAISLLDREYSDKQLSTTFHLNKLYQWPQVPLNDACAYKKLHRFLLGGHTYKRDGKLVELDSESVIRSCILAKMDRSVQNK